MTDTQRQPNLGDMKPHLRRVLSRVGGPNSMPRGEDGTFLLQGQYWDGGLPSQARKMQKVDGVPLCKRYFVGEEHDASRCPYKHLDYKDRPPCDMFSVRAQYCINHSCISLPVHLVKSTSVYTSELLYTSQLLRLKHIAGD